MYQGKFSSNNKKQAEVNAELLAQRNAAKQKSARLPEQRMPREEPELLDMPRNRRQAPQNPQPQLRKSQPEQSYEPDEREYVPAKRGPGLLSVIFYTFYFMLILLFAGGTYLTLNYLQDWLVKYEAAQPTTKCQQVFDQLFKNPDWAALYDMAGIEDTKFEGRDAYVIYMTNKVGGQALNYVETSAGLSGKKYFVRLNDERIGSFTLEGQQESVTDIPDWQLGKVELYITRDVSCRIKKADGDVAYVNGVVLDDSYTVQIASTKADKFLPVGVSSASSSVQEVDGLLVLPTVTVTDKTGKAMAVEYDADNNMYVEQTVTTVIPEDLKQTALSTGETYGKYMIAAASGNDLAAKIDASSEIYKTITGVSLWMQKNNGYKITDESVTDYARYSDNIFSARVKLTLNVTRTDGTVKPYDVNSTFFFTQSNGKWKCYDMTNENVMEPVGKVRLTFMDGDTKLDSVFVATDATEFTTPVLSAPAGKVFAGWTRQVVDENGNKSLSLVFVPDADGKVTVQNGTTLEPMVLYTYYENAQA